MKPEISVVSPVYKASNGLIALVERVTTELKKITNNFEIILVDDGSPFNDWDLIQDLAKHNKNLIGIKLSRNFGQHYAITAGLSNAQGKWIVVMDCDLQDRPEEIGNLYNAAIKGYDLVFAKRANRKDNLLKRLSSKIFYYIFSYLTGTKQDPAIANFGIYKDKVIKAILSMEDQTRYFPTMSQWVGFKKTYLNVEHAERADGKSSYSWRMLLNLAFDNILAFSNKPMKLTVTLGLAISLLSFISGLFYLYMYLTGHVSVLGFTSLIISISFFSGIIILILGIIGLYLAKVFDKVKGRPSYIIDKIINANEFE
jgi:glycosyltransferase involved in cell wall biosynthesis